MRILEVVVRYPPYVGGVENSVYHVATQLAARGHEVRVVCADEPEGSPAEVEGVSVVRLPWRFKLANTNLCFGLWEALRREKADVIHTHVPTVFFAEMAAAAAEAMGIPLVLTYHNDPAGEGIKGLLTGLYNRLRLPRVLEASTRIVTTNPLHSPVLDPYESKLVCIPWGVEVERFIPAEEPEGPLTVGFLSLLDAHHRYKGLDVLLEAIAEIPEVRLKIGGRGEDREWYRHQAEELGIEDRVEFLGFVPDLNSFYASCHVFALPSTDPRREGFGLVLLEAMACGRPVITTPIVGIAGDVEPRGVGVLVPPNDPHALASALMSLRENRSELPGTGRRARLLVEERYTWERVTDDYERLFTELGRTVRPDGRTIRPGS
ncbi:MAG TPA: glycosyltransferase family 4 protein [Thermoanaerobaculia bacterium]|nr:glycosyltransferase family 4 protein [Thermoanaerobaculia bacterium]